MNPPPFKIYEAFSHDIHISIPTYLNQEKPHKFLCKIYFHIIAFPFKNAFFLGGGGGMRIAPPPLLPSLAVFTSASPNVIRDCWGEEVVLDDGSARLLGQHADHVGLPLIFHKIYQCFKVTDIFF